MHRNLSKYLIIFVFVLMGAVLSVAQDPPSSTFRERMYGKQYEPPPYLAPGGFGTTNPYGAGGAKFKYDEYGVDRPLHDYHYNGRNYRYYRDYAGKTVWLERPPFVEDQDLEQQGYAPGYVPRGWSGPVAPGRAGAYGLPAQRPGYDRDYSTYSNPRMGFSVPNPNSSGQGVETFRGNFPFSRPSGDAGINPPGRQPTHVDSFQEDEEIERRFLKRYFPPGFPFHDH